MSAGPYDIICSDCNKNVAVKVNSEEELQQIVNSQDREGTTTDFLCKECWDETGGDDELTDEEKMFFKQQYKEYLRLTRKHNQRPLSFPKWLELYRAL